MYRLMDNNKNKTFRASDGAMIYLFAIIAVFVVSNGVGVVFSGADSLIKERSAKEVFEMFTNGLLQAALIGVYVAYCRAKKVKPQIGINDCHYMGYIMGVVFAAVSLFGYVMLAGLADTGLEKIGFSMELFGTDSMGIVTIPGRAAMIILTVILAPIAEELIFRSALISGLRRKLGFVPCVLLNGVMFSLMHMNPAQTVYQFGLGCSLAALAMSTGSVIPCMICHASSNLAACVMEFFPKTERILLGWTLSASFTATVVLSIVTAVVAAGIISALTYMLYAMSKKKYAQRFEIKSSAPAFFDPNTLQPVFEEDSDIFPRKNHGDALNYGAQNSSAQNSSAAYGGNFDEDVQRLLRREYERKNGETGGMLGFNTFAKAIIIGLLLCTGMWFLALGMGIAG